MRHLQHFQHQLLEADARLARRHRHQAVVGHPRRGVYFEQIGLARPPSPGKAPPPPPPPNPPPPPPSPAVRPGGRAGPGSAPPPLSPPPGRGATAFPDGRG